jgi:dTDP-D-glucose 4,6-dehydratase
MKLLVTGSAGFIGKRAVEWAWTHCEDGSPQCVGDERDWAQDGEPKGKWCGRDQ